MSTAKRMVRLPPTSGSTAWTGPVLIRGWLRVRHPWRHPIAAVQLTLKWRRVRRALDGAPGFLSFEYWQRLESLLFGMHVAWATHEDSDKFDRHPSHVDIARWAMKSRLICAMKLETLAVDGDGRIIRLGGFHISERESDLPGDALFPARA
jgi:heme-degrading monooxygenase HmoA